MESWDFGSHTQSALLTFQVPLLTFLWFCPSRVTSGADTAHCLLASMPVKRWRPDSLAALLTIQVSLSASQCLA